MIKTIGYISYTHGLDGKVKIVPMVDCKSFENFIKNTDIFLKDKKIEIHIVAFNGKSFICKIQGVDKIEKAQQIIKNEIYINIENSNIIDAESILDFDVYIENFNKKYGKIVDYGDYGNGIVIEIQLEKSGKSEFYKCDNENIVSIDLAKKQIFLKKRDEI